MKQLFSEITHSASLSMIHSRLNTTPGQNKGTEKRLLSKISAPFCATFFLSQAIFAQFSTKLTDVS